MTNRNRKTIKQNKQNGKQRIKQKRPTTKKRSLTRASIKRRCIKPTPSKMYVNHALNGKNGKNGKRVKKYKGGMKKQLYCKASLVFKNLSKNMICYELDQTDSAALSIKLEEPIPESCNKTITLKKCNDCTPVSYMTILNALSNISSGRIVTIFGGAVRDYIHSNFTNYDALTDIDINYRADWNDVVDMFNEYPFTCFNRILDENKKYIMVGSKTAEEYLEGFYIGPRAYYAEDLESRCNSISIIVNQEPMVIVDFFGGQGIEDARQKHYCAPYMNDDLNDEKLMQWITNNHQDRALWRMLKFANRGYTVDVATAKTIYKYWWSQKDTKGVYPSDVKWGKIWYVLDPIDTEKIFGKDGIMHKQLTTIPTIIEEDGIPSYNDMMNILIEKGYISSEGEGNIIPSESTKQISR